jgi:hypothetical protein
MQGFKIFGPWVAIVVLAGANLNLYAGSNSALSGVAWGLLIAAVCYIPVLFTKKTKRTRKSKVLDDPPPPPRRKFVIGVWPGRILIACFLVSGRFLMGPRDHNLLLGGALGILLGAVFPIAGSALGARLAQRQRAQHKPD